MEATERQLLATLERYGVKPIDTRTANSIPTLHQAIAEVPGDGKQAGSIVDVRLYWFSYVYAESFRWTYSSAMDALLHRR